MAISGFGATKLIGGTAGCLDDIIHTNLADGDLAIVVDAVNDKAYHYTYNISRVIAATSSPDYIVATSNATGTGSWDLTKEQSFSSFIRGVIDSDNLSEFLNGLSLEYDWLYYPASAFTPSSTNGCTGVSKSEYSDTGVVDRNYLSFDGTTDQYAFLEDVFPPSWDRSTIKFKFIWSGAAGCSQSDIVTWGADGLSLSDDDNIDGVAHGTSVTVDDTITAGLSGDTLTSAATGAMTFAGSPALGDILNIRVYRDADGTEGSDNMTENAHLFGVLIQIKRTNEVAAW